MRALKNSLKPFEPILADPGCTDIVVNKCGEIGAEINGAWHWWQADLDFNELDCLCMQTAYYAGDDFSPEHPICTAPLPDGQRCHMVRPNATDHGHISLTIRRPPSFRPTVSALAERGMFIDGEAPDVAVQTMQDKFQIEHDLAVRLERAVIDHKNILICGAVGSGKTTLSRALIDCIPNYERIITIEDTREWHDLKHRNWVPLSYTKNGQGVSKIGAKDLVESSLRMRPDRVLLGELRDDAAYYYIRSAIAGHPGGITTLHADTAEGAFDAIVYMIREHQAGSGLQNADIYEMLKKRIDIVLHCKHEPARRKYWVDDVWTRSSKK